MIVLFLSKMHYFSFCLCRNYRNLKLLHTQSCSQVLSFRGANIHVYLGAQDFCFYYMFKTFFLDPTKFGIAQKNFGGGIAPDPVHTPSKI